MSNMDNTASTPRCTTRACPVVYKSGPPRPCPMHSDGDDSLLSRMAAFEALSAAPGEVVAEAAGEGEGNGQ